MHDFIATRLMRGIDCLQRGQHLPRGIQSSHVIELRKVGLQPCDGLNHHRGFVRPLEIDDYLVPLRDPPHGVDVLKHDGARLERKIGSVVRVQRIDGIRLHEPFELVNLVLDHAIIRDGGNIAFAFLLQIRGQDKVLGIPRAGHEGDITFAHTRNHIESGVCESGMAPIKVDIAAIDDGLQRHFIPLNHVEAMGVDHAAIVEGLLHGDSDGGAAGLGRAVVEEQVLRVARGRGHGERGGRGGANRGLEGVQAARERGEVGGAGVAETRREEEHGAREDDDDEREETRLLARGGGLHRWGGGIDSRGGLRGGGERGYGVSVWC